MTIATCIHKQSFGSFDFCCCVNSPKIIYILIVGGSIKLLIVDLLASENLQLLLLILVSSCFFYTVGSFIRDRYTILHFPIRDICHITIHICSMIFWLFQICSYVGSASNHKSHFDFINEHSLFQIA